MDGWFVCGLFAGTVTIAAIALSTNIFNNNLLGIIVLLLMV